MNLSALFVLRDCFTENWNIRTIDIQSYNDKAWVNIYDGIGWLLYMLNENNFTWAEKLRLNLVVFVDKTMQILGCTCMYIFYIDFAYWCDAFGSNLRSRKITMRIFYFVCAILADALTTTEAAASGFMVLISLAEAWITENCPCWNFY